MTKGGMKMDYDALLKAISDATALRKLIDAKVAERTVLEGQIADNEQEMARLAGLKKITAEALSALATVNAESDTLNKELGQRMKKLKSAGVELPLSGDAPRGIVHV
jgi:hypothetical protein